MGRHPKARQTVLSAARRIVIERGAGALTFEELAAESGVTRGGITYHFSTKEDLLAALVEEDIKQWREVGESLAPPELDYVTGELVASIRHAACKAAGEENRRFVSGMIAAAALNPVLLQPCRDYFQSLFPKGRWSERDLRRALVRLAADGLFWTEVFDLYEFPPSARKRLVALMEQLAIDAGDTPPSD
ncbi:MAG: TetR/AcrR family transcriptional regulator [Pseudomonadota bacterium]